MLTPLSSHSYVDGGSASCDHGGMPLNDRIRTARKTVGLSQQDLGDLMGVSRAAVAQWESSNDNATSPTLDKFEGLTDHLKIDPVYLLSGKHSSSFAKTAQPGVGTVSVSEYDIHSPGRGKFEISDATKRDVWLFSKRYLEQELKLSKPRLFVIEVTSDSMTPTLTPGDRVLVNMNDKRLSQHGVFVIWEYDGPVFTRLTLIPGTPQMVSRAFDNTRHVASVIPAGDLKIIGRIVWVSRRL